MRIDQEVFALNTESHWNYLIIAPFFLVSEPSGIKITYLAFLVSGGFPKEEWLTLKEQNQKVSRTLLMECSFLQRNSHSLLGNNLKVYILWVENSNHYRWHSYLSGQEICFLFICDKNFPPEGENSTSITLLLWLKLYPPPTNAYIEALTPVSL